MVLRARDFLGAELAEVFSHELGVQQPVAAADQTGHEVDQRHLRGVPPAGEHALAEEGAAERDAVQAAHQLAVLPALDAVGVALLVQAQVQTFDGSVDPGLAPAG